MLRTLVRSVETAKTGTVAVIGAMAGLDDYEREAVEAFLKYPNGENVNTLATYASVESETVEQTFDTLPDVLVWREEGKWQVLLRDWS